MLSKSNHFTTLSLSERVVHESLNEMLGPEQAPAFRPSLDQDGVPPGMDPSETGLIGQQVTVHFSGNFYAMKGRWMSFSRKATILLPLRTHFVLLDNNGGSIYLIDRKTRVSLGCQMSTYLALPDGGRIL